MIPRSPEQMPLWDEFGQQPLFAQSPLLLGERAAPWWVILYRTGQTLAPQPSRGELHEFKVVPVARSNLIERQASCWGYVYSSAGWEPPNRGVVDVAGFAVLDFETTGFAAEYDRVVEVGLVLLSAEGDI